MDRAHALVDPHNRYVLWWNARCGCTSAKAWYLKALGFSLGPLADRTLGVPILGASIHDVVDKLAPRIPFPHDSLATIEAAIVRNPFARLVSHFQGFIGRHPGAPHVLNLKSPQQAYNTFREFVKIICDTPNCFLEQHVALQTDAWKTRSPTLIRLEEIDKEWAYWLVRVRMHPDMFPKQNCRMPGPETSKPLADVPMEALAEYNGSFPPWRNYYDKHLLHSVRLKYAPDFQQLPY